MWLQSLWLHRTRYARLVSLEHTDYVFSMVYGISNKFIVRNHLIFQAQWRELFPSMASIIKYRDILRFACGLTTESQLILEFVYETFLKEFPILDRKKLVSFMKNVDKVDYFDGDDDEDGDGDDQVSVLLSMCKEVSGSKKMDPLRNKHLTWICNEIMRRLSKYPVIFTCF